MGDVDQPLLSKGFGCRRKGRDAPRARLELKVVTQQGIQEASLCPDHLTCCVGTWHTCLLPAHSRAHHGQRAGWVQLICTALSLLFMTCPRLLWTIHLPRKIPLHLGSSCSWWHSSATPAPGYQADQLGGSETPRMCSSQCPGHLAQLCLHVVREVPQCHWPLTPIICSCPACGPISPLAADHGGLAPQPGFRGCLLPMAPGLGDKT